MNKHRNYFYLLRRRIHSFSVSLFTRRILKLKSNFRSQTIMLFCGRIAHIPKLSKLKFKCTVNIIVRHVWVRVCIGSMHTVRTPCAVQSWIIIIVSRYEDVWSCSLFACVVFIQVCVFFLLLSPLLLQLLFVFALFHSIPFFLLDSVLFILISILFAIVSE